MSGWISSHLTSSHRNFQPYLSYSKIPQHLLCPFSKANLLAETLKYQKRAPPESTCLCSCCCFGVPWNHFTYWTEHSAIVQNYSHFSKSRSQRPLNSSLFQSHQAENQHWFSTWADIPPLSTVLFYSRNRLLENSHLWDLDSSFSKPWKCRCLGNHRFPGIFFSYWNANFGKCAHGRYGLTEACCWCWLYALPSFTHKSSKIHLFRQPGRFWGSCICDSSFLLDFVSTVFPWNFWWCFCRVRFLQPHRLKNQHRGPELQLEPQFFPADFLDFLTLGQNIGRFLAFLQLYRLNYLHLGPKLDYFRLRSSILCPP